MLMSPLLSLNNVFSLMIKQERQFNSVFSTGNLGVIALLLLKVVADLKLPDLDLVANLKD